MHMPMTHVWFVHGAGGPQLPVMVHVTTLLPEHSRSPGPHKPVHTPPMHTWWVQGAGTPHCPMASHT
jgi:hypothetical protein